MAFISRKKNYEIHYEFDELIFDDILFVTQNYVDCRRQCQTSFITIWASWNENFTYFSTVLPLHMICTICRAKDDWRALA